MAAEKNKKWLLWGGLAALALALIGGVKMLVDKLTIDRILLAHPTVREELRNILAELQQAAPDGYKVRFTSTLRTFKEQQALYNQGRTTRGKIVTNAKPGESWHNYGLAVDIVLFKGQSYIWDPPSNMVAIFKRYGWKWGGDFRTFKDPPHFEKTFGLTTAEAKKRYDNKQVDTEGYILI